MKVTYLPPPSDAESDEYRARRRDARPAAEWRTKWGSSDCDGDDKEGEMLIHGGGDDDPVGAAMQRLAERQRLIDQGKNEGAQADRDATRAYVKRRLKKALQLQLDGPSGVEQLQAVLAYLDGRPARYAAAPGGLSGRKRK